ncbi:MAG: hypothetical protein BMS9Abin08_0998 [Gammaproteobacteria bacterium]|nr:MAG: hypothetical protein BMS9Abin08_0998 [Gammaproteobacteria bacterium]
MMPLWNSRKYPRAPTGMHILAVVVLLFFFQPPVFSMQMWEQLLEEQFEEANNGDAEAQYGVGIKYLKGQGVKQDRKEAIRWLEQAAASGHEGAKDKLQRLQVQQKQFEKIIGKAKVGDLKAQYEAGIMYLKGKGVEVDGGKARSWIGKAADQGDRKAITRLGILHYKGEGGAKDYGRALDLFNSVSNDSVLAQYYLGEMYADGKGVDRNYTTAIAWYKKAADGGFERAGGKIINMEEELKMEERRKANTARKAEAKKTALSLVVEKQQAEARQQAAQQRAKAAQQAEAKKLAEKRKKEAAAAAKRAIKLTPLEKLAGKQWTRKKKPVEYLPSKVTGCEMEDGELVCFSDLLTRTSGSQTLQYRVKSEVKLGQGVFSIAYRNLVLDVVNVQSDDDELLGYDDEIDQGFLIQTGWTQDHKVECRLNVDKGLDCIKDQTHKMVFVGK